MTKRASCEADGRMGEDWQGMTRILLAQPRPVLAHPSTIDGELSAAERHLQPSWPNSAGCGFRPLNATKCPTTQYRSNRDMFLNPKGLPGAFVARIENKPATCNRE
jgi:hypothetical protein